MGNMNAGRNGGWRNKSKDLADNKLIKIQIAKKCVIPKSYLFTPEQKQEKGVATKD